MLLLEGSNAVAHQLLLGRAGRPAGGHQIDRAALCARGTGVRARWAGDQAVLRPLRAAAGPTAAAAAGPATGGHQQRDRAEEPNRAPRAPDVTIPTRAHTPCSFGSRAGAIARCYADLRAPCGRGEMGSGRGGTRPVAAHV